MTPYVLLFSILFLSTFTFSTTTTTTNFSSNHHVTLLRSHCTTTPHPSTCIATIKISLPITLIPPSFLSSAFQSITAAISTLSTSPLLDHASSHLSIAEPRRSSLQDCYDLHNISLSSLRFSAASLHSPSPSSSDINTHLSAALTNRRTCLDGLQGASGHDLPALLHSISETYEHVSNALSLVTSHSKTRSRRKLLDHRFPTWLSRKDRRILQEVESPNNDVGLAFTVAKDGSADFTTIGEAVANVPSKNYDRRTFIWIRAGIYDENVDIPVDKVNIAMVGEGSDVTVIRGRRSAADGWTTFRSATLVARVNFILPCFPKVEAWVEDNDALVCISESPMRATKGVAAQGFLARDLTIENVAGAGAGQAVALRVNADTSAFYRCTVAGFQDTLYVHSFRQFYRECNIFGTVDFVFGNAAAVLQSCNLIARVPMHGQSNVVTAQGRDDPNEDTGISIDRCAVIASDDLADGPGNVRTYLGRPWQPYSTTVVMKSFLDGLVDPSGWLEWEGHGGLETLYYGEYDNYGPGSDTSNRVEWFGYHVMNRDEALDFSVSEFLLGDEWLGDSSFPYDGGV